MKNSYILSFWKANSTDFEFLLIKQRKFEYGFSPASGTIVVNSKNINK